MKITDRDMFFHQLAREGAELRDTIELIRLARRVERLTVAQVNGIPSATERARVERAIEVDETTAGAIAEKFGAAAINPGDVYGPLRLRLASGATNDREREAWIIPSR
jgi:hypothetical protein